MQKLPAALLCCLALLSGLPLFSQRMIEIRSEPDASGGFVFYCTNRAACNYIVSVRLTNMYNVKSDHILPFVGEVKPGSNQLFKLSKSNPGDSIGFNYKSGYRKGCIDTKTDTGFAYLLPIAPGKEAQAYEVVGAGSATTGATAAEPATTAPASYVSSDPKAPYAIRLRMHPGDTIFAARKGIVTEVVAGNQQNDAGLTSTGEGNYIEIVHADCSFASYGILRKDGAFVHVGQLVQAGDPIGLVGGDKYGRGSDIRFSVYYSTSAGEPWSYVPIRFWTRRNGKGMLKHGATYTSEFPDALLTKEMNKQELQRWKATHPRPGTPAPAKKKKA